MATTTTAQPKRDGDEEPLVLLTICVELIEVTTTRMISSTSSSSGGGGEGDVARKVTRSEARIGDPILLQRPVPLSFITDPTTTKACDLLAIDMNVGDELAEFSLDLRLRNVTTLFGAPLAHISDPGPPRLRFTGNLPKLRSARRAMQRLYGFTHLVGAAANHSLQYVLGLTGTAQESGNMVFGPKRLVALEQAVSRGWGGVQPLFRFSMLRALDVSDTFFGDVGFSVVLTAVHLCQRIEVLGIARVGITGRTIPNLVATLLRHDGVESIDIRGNELLEISGEDLLRLPRNNVRITQVNAAEGNGFSKYITRRLERYCRDNLDAFNSDPLNPFGAACSYISDAKDIPDDLWQTVSELWLALTATASLLHKAEHMALLKGDLLSSGSAESNERKLQMAEQLMQDVSAVDEEGVLRERMAADAPEEKEEENEEESNSHSAHLRSRKFKKDDKRSIENDFLIPPTATAPLLSLVWWRAFEQVISKIDDPMVLLAFAPVAKPVVTRQEIPREKKKKRSDKNSNKKVEKTDDEEGAAAAAINAADATNQAAAESNEAEEQEEDALVQIQDDQVDEATLDHLEHFNDVLRHKARQQWQTSLLRAFVVALPFAHKSWHHVRGALIGIGESLRGIGVTLVDLRRFHLALVEALKIEVGVSSFDVVRQAAWAQVASLVFRTLMLDC